MQFGSYDVLSHFFCNLFQNHTKFTLPCQRCPSNFDSYMNLYELLGKIKILKYWLSEVVRIFRYLPYCVYTLSSFSGKKFGLVAIPISNRTNYNGHPSLHPSLATFLNAVVVIFSGKFPLKPYELCMSVCNRRKA